MRWPEKLLQWFRSRSQSLTSSVENSVKQEQERTQEATETEKITNSSSTYHKRLKRIREEYSHAYDRWSRDEEDELMYLLDQGMKPQQIAQRLRRQPSAIRSRIRRIGEQGLLDEPNADADIEATPLPWSLKATESAFLPLATSWMSESAVCVAGIDLHSQKWIRLVRKGTHSLGKQDATQYSYGQVYAVELGGFQERPPKDDPRGLHIEDRILRGSPRLLSKITCAQRIQLLQGLCNEGLHRALLARRSLFAVEPIWFTCTRREDDKIIVAFGTEETDTKELRRSQVLREQGIRVSSGGCPCNCLPWMNSARAAKQGVFSMDDITRTAPAARVFFVLSLTSWASNLPEDKQGHYLILAGIHVLDEEKEWL